MNHYARNADLSTILRLLQEQEVRKVDMIVQGYNLRGDNGHLVVSGTDPVITEDGVTMADGRFLPTAVADEGVAEKLGIPLAYVRRLRNEHIELWDENVNGWLRRAEEKQYMLRTFRPQGEGDVGVARALLSDRYSIMDNLDVLMATLDGVREAGVSANVSSGDLSERRMVVRIVSPEITAMAPTLLKGYRYGGKDADDYPLVWAGIKITNSETGGGAFSVVPEFEVQICKNGMTITKDAVRNVHLGGRMEEGVVDWSSETQQRALSLIKSKTVDAVRTFLDADYMERVIARAEEQAEERVARVEHVEVIAKKAAFTKEQIEGILGFFVEGGQMTRGGVFNAATAYAQTVQDPDEAYVVQQRSAALLGL